jgi:hypothetical protein
LENVKEKASGRRSLISDNIIVVDLRKIDIGRVE